MLKVVNLPMKKCYHYFYSVDGFVPGNTELVDADSFFPDKNGIYRDVVALLDHQQFDIRKSVVSKLVEYAGKQFNNP